MNSATVIIGSGYGDEGKGLATDYFAHPPGERALVVRFNGGAQAGHTVQTPEGLRHVFSHFGSGSLAGAATYLSRFFVCHPILFHTERQALDMLGVKARVLVDPACPITTPYDVMINQCLESSRGQGRHGSCGIGFGETLERQTRPGFGLRVVDLLKPRQLAQKLLAIRDVYLPLRLRELSLPMLDNALCDDHILEHFIDDAIAFMDAVQLSSLDQAASGHEVIYEGAQGLGLDMDRGCFPHVTRSNTGLRNAVCLSREIGIESLEVVYATRTYLTRHGAGPLKHELAEKPWARIEDATNQGNRWQGTLRFAWLDLDSLGQSIRADLRDADGLACSTTLLVTCLDQTDDTVRFVVDGRLRSGSKHDLLEAAAAVTGVDKLLGSFGATRASLRKLMQTTTWKVAG